MKTRAIVELNKEGRFYVYTPDLESTLLGEGNSASEAIADFETTYRNDIVEYALENNEVLPDELKDLSFEYSYDIASFLSYFCMLNMSKLGAFLGINPSLLRQYKRGGAYISKRQLKKIEDRVHELGKYLLEAKLTV